MSRLDDIFRELGFPTPPKRPAQPVYDEHRDLPVGECGKVNFPSEKMARQRRVVLLQHKGNTSFLRVYYCKVCHAYHLTSKR
jgi:hypothetical protein